MRRTWLVTLLLGTFLAACGGDKTIDDGGDDLGDGGAADGGSSGDGGSGDGGATSDDCGDSPETACPVELGSFPMDSSGNYDYDLSWMADEEIGEAGDRDWFAVDLEEGDMVMVASLDYIWDEDGEPDTVLRIYDPDGELLATNDDMPHRFQETDSALPFQATTTGTYYIEVLEWSDWADESTSASGGPSYDYELHGWAFGVTEIESNDTQAEVDELAAGYETWWYEWYPDAFASYALDFWGMMDDAGDVDIYAMEFSEDSDGAYYMWSIWPTTLGDLQPVMSLYDADWNLLARTDDPVYSLDRYVAWGYDAFLYDVGIAWPVEGGAVYYLAVEDAAGASGVGTFYPGVMTGYVAELSQPEEEPNDLPGQGLALEMTESSATADWYYARFDGNLAADDEADSFLVYADDVGGLGGKYLTVTLYAEAYGSLLDATITVYDDDGSTVLATADTNDYDGGPDPAVFDLELPDSDSFYVVITGDSDPDEDLANHYFGFLAVTPEPEF